MLPQLIAMVSLSLCGQIAPQPSFSVDLMTVKHKSCTVDLMGVSKTVVRTKMTRQCSCQNCPATMGSVDCDQCPCGVGYNFPAPSHPIVRNPPVGTSRPIPAAEVEVYETFEQTDTVQVARKGKRGGGGIHLFRLKKATSCGPGGCG